ncbi:hypothetical protein DYB26_005523 [Aphanomyces astaci]|uniref:Uncharacterized protein n=1 Tax=Aphanomyces astaci TaxID=112090 RepID=A0A418BXV9_APHAT|nr:hypothetical protein DYB34_000582 [Aphanomyces astaci]RHY83753.1 hypothetical protein DYB26_005523 [Aphanomyces astaci]
MPRKNSMPAGESSRSSDHRTSASPSGGGGGRGRRYNRWTLVVVSGLLAFFVLSELRYQQGCDVSESFSRHTSRIGGITLSVLDKVNVIHWLAFGTLMEALLLANAKGDADTLLAAAKSSVGRRPPPLDMDFHVSTVEIAVDTTSMDDTAFWHIVTELEANDLHVHFDPSQRMMRIFDKDESFDPTALPNKYIPSWCVSEPYHAGQPHAMLWFVHRDTKAATYSVKQDGTNRRRVFAEQDVVPFKHLDFLGRVVAVPANAQKVVAQEFAKELHDGIVVR